MPPSKHPNILAELIRRGAQRAATEVSLGGGAPVIDPGVGTDSTPAADLTAHVSAADPHPLYILKALLTTKGDLITRDAAVPVRVAVGADGEVLSADAASAGGVKWIAPAAGGGGGGGAVTKIAAVVLAADTATIDFSGIPATFEDLLIVLHGRTDTAAAYGANLLARFNNDASAIYDWSWKGLYSATSIEGAYADNDTSGVIGRIEGAGSVATYPATTEMRIPAYARTTFKKTALATWGVVVLDPDATNGEQGLANFVWKNTAAIARVTFLLGGASKFKAGTVATLYGIGGAGGGGGSGSQRTLVDDACADAALPAGAASTGQLTYDATKLRRELGGTSASSYTTPGVVLDGPLDLEVYLERLSTVGAGHISLELLNGAGTVVASLYLQNDANVVNYDGDIGGGYISAVSGDAQYRHWRVNLDVTENKRLNVSAGWGNGVHLWNFYTTANAFAAGDTMAFRIRTTSTAKAALYGIRVYRGTSGA